MGNFLNIS